MPSRSLPTPAKAITPEMVAFALSKRSPSANKSGNPEKDLKKLRAERTAPRPKMKASPLMAKRVVQISEPVPDNFTGPVHPSAFEQFKNLGKDRFATGLAAGMVTVLDARDRVTASRFRTVQQRLPYRKDKPLATETPERGKRAANGLQKESLSINQGHERSRVLYPFRMVWERVGSAVSELAVPIKSGKGRPKDVTFDKCLDFGEGPNIRWALSKYIGDHDIAYGRSAGGFNLQVTFGSDPHNRLPLSEDREIALRTIGIVNKYLGQHDRKAAKDLVDTFLELDPSREPLSMLDYASKKAGITVQTYGDGFYIGYYWNLGERLFDIYRIELVARECQVRMCA